MRLKNGDIIETHASKVFPVPAWELAIEPQNVVPKENLKNADHPLSHDSKKDNPEADRPYQYGDDEWVDIGPGSFNDSRDEIGRAK